MIISKSTKHEPLIIEVGVLAGKYVFLNYYSVIIQLVDNNNMRKWRWILGKPGGESGRIN